MTRDEPSPAPIDFFMKAIAFELGLGLVALVLGWLFGHDPLHSLVAQANHTVMAVVWGIVATIPMIVALLLFDRFPMGPLKSVRKFTDKFVVPLFKDQKLWQLLLLSAAAGFGEETLFRGLIQSGLADWLEMPGAHVIALLIASVVFGLCHWLTSTYAIMTMIVGMYLGLLYIAFDSLLVPILVHGLYDFFALAYFLKRHPADTSHSSQSH